MRPRTHQVKRTWPSTLVVSARYGAAALGGNMHSFTAKERYMRLLDICIRNVVSVERRMSVSEAAELMRSRHVGALVVVDAGKRGPNPVGSVTDRDIVVQVLAGRLDPASVTVGDIMPVDLVTASQDQEVFEVIQQMQHY